MLLTLPDGTLVNDRHGVIFFGLERFYEDIVLGDRCFMCGASRESKKFNDEHVLPKWLLAKAGLFDKFISLPNDKKFRYDRYKLPCCVSCNSTIGSEIEEPVSRIVNLGATGIASFLEENGPLLLYTWMALLFLKTHLKDGTLRAEIDQRLGDAKIAEAHPWQYLHHIHVICRGFFVPTRFQSKSIGTVLVLPAVSEGENDFFDYGDLTYTQSMFVKIGKVAIFVVFNDAGGGLQAIGPMLRKITGPLNAAQLRELLVELAFVNIHLKHRPQIRVELGPGEVIDYGVDLPDEFDLNDLDNSIRGGLGGVDEVDS